MEKSKESLLDIELNALLPKLINKSFAFACWQMPNSAEKNLVVSLTKPDVHASINGLDPGFLFNQFADNHPKGPLHIKADIVFKDNKISIDPRINDEQLQEFKQSLEFSEPAQENSRLQNHVQSNFEELVARAINKIKNGTFEKVVLSRFKDIDIPKRFNLEEFFNLVCTSYPNAFCSMIQLPGNGIWIGASPELLISNNNERFKTSAIAGTKKLQSNQPLSEIAWTQKEIEEQAFVSRYVINCFKKIRLREFEEYGPKTIMAGDLAHLRTVFEVNYKEVAFEGLADQMLDLLHPTSAVCGMPMEAARQFIHEEEQYDRSFYSGFLGPVNFEGSTDLFVNLRCMYIVGDQARLFAGAGITEDSNPEKEKDETELKMDTLMSLIDK